MQGDQVNPAFVVSEEDYYDIQLECWWECDESTKSLRKAKAVNIEGLSQAISPWWLLPFEMMTRVEW